jgi:thiamine biosynthesis protein ThiI
VERDLLLKIAGEIGTKSPRTRRRFLRLLARNVRRALRRAGVDGTVEQGWARLVVRTPEPRRAREAVRPVFGLHSVSEVEVLPAAELDPLVDAATQVFRPLVAGRTFAVRARRSGDHPYRSPDVAVRLGRALLDDSAGVDLDHPQVTVGLEIAGDRAYALLEPEPGAGGLPLGSGGRALALFSGGFDSPVAAWMAMRRGTTLDLLICDLGGCAQVDAALEVARALALRWAPGVEPRAHVVDLAPLVGALRATVEPRLRQVVLKRGMYRAGTELARKLGADALVTGESLGQVSTQTLRNLTVADEAAGVPVLRPLIGMDKEEILARARVIGTHAASERVQEHCNIATGRVETAARLHDVVGAEGAVAESFVTAAVVERRTVNLVGWKPGPGPEHVVAEVPEDAVIVDVREPEEGPDAAGVRLPFSAAATWANDLDPSRTYVFVCSHGVRSETLAHELRRRGLRAFSLAGGVGRLPTRAA